MQVPPLEPELGSNPWAEGSRGLASGNQGAVPPGVGMVAGQVKRRALNLSRGLESDRCPSLFAPLSGTLDPLLPAAHFSA